MNIKTESLYKFLYLSMSLLLSCLPPPSLALSLPPSLDSEVAAAGNENVQLKHLLSINSDTSEGVSTPQYDATSR